LFTFIHTILRCAHRLGNVSLPFSTIYLNGSKAEGFFRVDTPMLNLAYTDPATSATRDRSDTSALNGSYLWVYATLDPPLVMPGEGATLAPAEQAFSRFCQQWVDTVSARPECTDRFITALCEDENQDTQIITQYVYPQPPPFDFKEGQFVRFISRIPFVEDVQASGVLNSRIVSTFSFVGNLFFTLFFQSRDVWCSAPAFLGMGFGDWEEHAVLLANYFIYLDMKQNQTVRISPNLFPDSAFEGTDFFVFSRVRSLTHTSVSALLYPKAVLCLCCVATSLSVVSNTFTFMMRSPGADIALSTLYVRSKPSAASSTARTSGPTFKPWILRTRRLISTMPTVGSPWCPRICSRRRLF
jgi:hypothetical protein